MKSLMKKHFFLTQQKNVLYKPAKVVGNWCPNIHFYGICSKILIMYRILFHSRLSEDGQELW